jgi:hypothetical protein
MKPNGTFSKNLKRAEPRIALAMIPGTRKTPKQWLADVNKKRDKEKKKMGY